MKIFIKINLSFNNLLPVTTCSSAFLSVLRLNMKSPSARDNARLPICQFYIRII
jgi:hypothetical protein